MKAYVVARFERRTYVTGIDGGQKKVVSEEVSVLAGVGLYTTGWGQLTLPHRREEFYVDLVVAEAATWEEARALAIENLRSHPGTRFIAERLIVNEGATF